MGVDSQQFLPDPFRDTEHIQTLNKVPPPPSTGNNTSSLPPGWGSATAPDGRVYYYEESTGKSSWTLPSVQAPASSAPVHQPAVSPSVSSDSRAASGIMATRSMKSHHSEYDTPINAARTPNNHQCYAIVAILLFFPFGIFALIHSLKVDSAWENGRFGPSVNHSRQALLFSRLSVGIGAVFWIYFLFFSGPGGFVFDWPRIFD